MRDELSILELAHELAEIARTTSDAATGTSLMKLVDRLFTEAGLPADHDKTGGRVAIVANSNHSKTKIQLPHCDTLLLRRAAETLIVDRYRLTHQASVACGTAKFTCLVSEVLCTRAAELCAVASQRCAIMGSSC